MPPKQLASVISVFLLDLKQHDSAVKKGSWVLQWAFHAGCLTLKLHGQSDDHLTSFRLSQLHVDLLRFRRQHRYVLSCEVCNFSLQELRVVQERLQRQGLRLSTCQALGRKRNIGKEDKAGLLLQLLLMMIISCCCC